MALLNPESLKKNKKKVSTTSPSSVTPKSTLTVDTMSAGQKAGYDAVMTRRANTTQETAPAQETSQESTYYPRYTQNEQQASDYLNTFQEPQSVEEIQKEKMKAARDEINGLNSYYSARLQEQRTVNQGNERATASVNTLTGLAGSTEANVTAGKAAATSQQANDKILAEKQMELGAILSGIRTSAQTEATAQKTEARLSAEQVMTQRKASMEEAVTNVTNLAKSGVTTEGYKQTDPEGYAYLAQKVGGEAQLKAMMTLNRPQETILDKRVENGRYVIAYQNPLTGAIRVETVDLGLPPEYTKSVDLGDQMMFMPDDFNPNDPDSPQPIYVPKGMSPDQQADNEIAWFNANTGRINANKNGGGGGADDQLYTGLTPATATAVRSKVTKFSSEPMVQNFATIQDGHNFASSISDTTTNPADHQALIYALAKALDPGSVVREGEYATAQKYAQSWVSAYGKGVSQALLGTGFLSEDAISNIKKVIEQKYISSKKSYDNLYGNYEKGINSLTGRDDGAVFLVDYATAGDMTGSADPEVQTAQNASIGEYVTIQGVRYVKRGEDDFEEAPTNPFFGTPLLSSLR